ncbi:tRNA dihydrouridine(20/20a) synthase DusA [Paroceanicella profunda]|uniref:tRNA-dihydrouridine(20/20a) synthase n=1 Tax=Paroceanicella profunda TaxID=2579971 RepID=A0A5B8FX39_9RHOB|nr:tRNA dihydrouridine(20/20a) synthase DusA [Paroceanicella profunda]QDL93115.1 tRNA dihydrouridine(20/20a) synthase DusA [Paroceanicella profunda]
MKKKDLSVASRLSVAPMMDWTDRHCRFLHRLMSRHAVLYTEMITAAALIHGDRERLLRFDAAEHPVALQLGGSEPDALAEAARIGAAAGYDEINLNVGCPSDRVQSGAFGACLMREPELVARCVAAMIAAVPQVEVTVKCRIGVDAQDPEQVLPDFLARVADAGCGTFIIHARKAWLEGLSPKENRDIPPLDYDIVHRMKARFPRLRIELNGGITSLDTAADHLAAGLDGVMIGRAAYHDPGGILPGVDALVTGASAAGRGPEEAVLAMLGYIEAECAAGTRLNQITRHMLGLFTGRPGARQWRRILSEGAHLPGAGPELVRRALESVLSRAA